MSDTPPPAKAGPPRAATQYLGKAELDAAGQYSLEFEYENGVWASVVIRLVQAGTLRVTQDGSAPATEFASRGGSWRKLPAGTSQFAVNAGDALRQTGMGANPSLQLMTVTWSYV